jgi:aromatic-L-amino-acid decarboxylase
MHSSLEEIGRESRKLELDVEELDTAMSVLLAASRRFLAGRRDDAAFRPASATRHACLDDPPADLGVVIEETVGALATGGGLTTTSGRYFGYIPGGGLPTAAFADFIAALVNSYSGTHALSPAAVTIENACMRWLLDAVGFPAEAWGALLSGGSLATITALVVAREQLRRDRSAAVVYLSDQTHLCVRKGLRTIGMAECRMRVIPTDADLRMCPRALEGAIVEDLASGLHPWLLVASAGTTNTGAVDPFDRLAEIARRFGLWFHVDGAYGGLFALTARGRELLRGIEHADSIVIDPHKAMFLPYGIGACLLRNGELLKATFSERAAYLADSYEEHERSPSDYSPELTRHFRGLRLWLSLRVHGATRFRAALEEKLALAEALHRELSAIDRIELIGRPQLSIVVFRHRDGDVATRSLLQRVLARGVVHISSTQIGGRFYLRACVLSFRTHCEQVDCLIEEIRLALRPQERPSAAEPYERE